MIAEHCHADLKLVAEAVEIHSPTQYSLLGELRDFAAAVPFVSPAPAQPAAAVPATPLFMSVLETDLYSRLYVRPINLAAAPSDLLAQRDHVSALSAANNGVGTWEPGWRIVSNDADGRVAVSKDQVTFWTQPAGVRTRSGKVRCGDFCRVWVGKEMRQLLPGFYFAFGNGDQQDNRDTSDPLVRFYWHLTATAAVEYMALVTTQFNRASIPFRTKVMADPAGYVRADAGVLYLERRYFPGARRLLLEIHQALERQLRPSVPMFTKPLAAGLGLAEDPNNQMSFGQSRCQIAARALWSCFLHGLTDEDARLAALAEAFRAAGLDPATPFLERGSTDFYTLTGELPASLHVARPARSPATRRPKQRWKGRAKKHKKVGA
jgi:HopA1 effector protein family